MASDNKKEDINYDEILQYVEEEEENNRNKSINKEYNIEEISVFDKYEDNLGKEFTNLKENDNNLTLYQLAASESIISQEYKYKLKNCSDFLQLISLFILHGIRQEHGIMEIDEYIIFDENKQKLIEKNNVKYNF